jgi:hypothetical protein
MYGVVIHCQFSGQKEMYKARPCPRPERSSVVGFLALAVRYPAYGAVQHPHLVEVKELTCTSTGVQDPYEVKLGDDSQHSAAVKEPVFPQGFNAIARGQLRTAVHDGW